MNKQIVKKHRLDEYDAIKDNLEYWLTRPASERTAVVDQLRQKNHGGSIKIQKTVRIIKLRED